METYNISQKEYESTTSWINIEGNKRGFSYDNTLSLYLLNSDYIVNNLSVLAVVEEHGLPLEPSKPVVINLTDGGTAIPLFYEMENVADEFIYDIERNGDWGSVKLETIPITKEILKQINPTKVIIESEFGLCSFKEPEGLKKLVFPKRIDLNNNMKFMDDVWAGLNLPIHDLFTIVIGNELILGTNNDEPYLFATEEDARKYIASYKLHDMFTVIQTVPIKTILTSGLLNHDLEESFRGSMVVDNWIVYYSDGTTLVNTVVKQLMIGGYENGDKNDER